MLVLTYGWYGFLPTYKPFKWYSFQLINATDIIAKTPALTEQIHVIDYRDLTSQTTLSSPIDMGTKKLIQSRIESVLKSVLYWVVTFIDYFSSANTIATYM